VKNHYGRTYFGEFMPTCLRGAVFLKHSVVCCQHSAGPWLVLRMAASRWEGRKRELRGEMMRGEGPSTSVEL